MGPVKENLRSTPRSLAGATILQVVPALSDDPAGHAAVDIALTLLQSGARALGMNDVDAFAGNQLRQRSRV